MFARATGLNPHDPADMRQRRRRSSSVSVGRSLNSSASESVIVNDGVVETVLGSRR